ncbi:MAG: tetratricopeptide repeat protein, partial [Luteibaculum sp.]
MKTLILCLLLLAFVGSKPLQSQETSDSTAICALAKDYLTNYQYEKALNALDSCPNADSNNVEFLGKKAFCELQLGWLKKAEATYLKILELDTLALAARNQLAGLYLKRNQLDKALRQYKKLVNIDSTNSYYYKRLGDISLKMGEVASAINFYDYSLYQNAKDLEVISTLVKIYQGLELYAQADSLINQGLALDSSDTELILYQAKAAYKLKRYDEVLNCAEKILGNSRDTSTYLLKLLGVANFHESNYALSIKMLEKLIDQKADSEIIHYYLGLGYRELGNAQKSIMHFNLAISLGVSDYLATYYTNLAITLEEMGDHQAAIRAYQAAYKSSKDEILLYHLARNYDAYYKNKETALRYYKMYLASNDTDNVAFNDYSKYRISELKAIVHFH